MKDAFKITCSALPDSTRVAGFRGTEGISRLYQFDVYLNVATEGQDVDLADAVGAKATLEIKREGGGPPFAFHGIFAAFELINQEGDNAHFHAVLVPQLWQLTQTLHSRMFTQKSIPDIIKAVLEDGGLGSDDYALQLSESYKPEEHVCQYKESSFDFLSRWMEREGMYYFFEQGDASEKLIITDKKSSHTAFGDKSVRFHASSGDVSSGEALHTLTCKHRALPAGVKLKDHNYANPTLDVAGKAPVSKTGLGEISAYGGRFFSPDDGKRLAKLRAEELLARQVLYHGAGTSPYLRPGYTFKLEDHPRSAFEMQYLAVEVEHFGNDGIESPELRRLTGIDGDRLYWVEVTAIPASTQFRAESRTPWPRIYGFEDGTICGPAESDYAQIDDQGRYNVKFEFDESDLKDGKASTFVRMMQPHGGDIEGFHFPLRKGTEVVFSFLGGDPDRPVISGVVPNLQHPSPVTKANHTRNVLQTGGRNRWELEDKEGQERITMSTPHADTFLRMGSPNEGHTMILHTKKATLLNAGTDLEVLVGQASDAGGSWDSLVATDWCSTVDKGGFTLSVGTGVMPAAAGQIDIKAKNDINITTTTGDYCRYVNTGMSLLEVQGDNTIQVYGGNHSEIIDQGNYKTTVSAGDYTATVSAGKTTFDTAKTTDILSKDLITIKSSGADVYIEGDNVTNHARSDKKYTILGDEYSFVNGNTQKLTIGHSKAITIGVTDSLFVGVNRAFKVSGELSVGVGLTETIFVGGKISAFVGLSMDVKLAGNFNVDASINYAINAAVKLGVNMVETKQAVAKMKQHGIDLTMGGLFGVL